MRALQHPSQGPSHARCSLAALVACVLVGCDQSEPPASAAAPPPPSAIAVKEHVRPNPRVVDEVQTIPGFQVELIHSVDAETEGSWVAICAGPDGVLYTADQYGSIFEVTPPAIDDLDSDAVVRVVATDFPGAQGLCWTNDSLFVMANGPGLMRLTDSDGDGDFEQRDVVLPLEGEGEHAPHAIRAHPDGHSLLIICGNHTRVPPLASSRFGAPFGEDLLLPREPDPRGHAAGVMAPGGFLARVDPDNGDVEFLSAGMRNGYDFAVDANGEVFTYDSDMEWDLGLPWYRPTRICHLVSGVDFGWRNGSGKWPDYYEDSLPPVVDIGPGSPTGVLFGDGATFPARYQRALFALDWTFGIIYAIHLEPRGASFGATVEQFLSGKPLPLTDAVVGADGAFYFTTGGRRIGSSLYRVTYTGQELTDPVEARPSSEDAARRRRLESLHRAGVTGDELDEIWEAMGDDDRFIRHAARVALEHQPLERYRSRALGEPDGAVRLEALIGLARSGSEADLDDVLASLMEIDVDSLDRQRRLGLARAFSLALVRLGQPAEADALIAHVEGLMGSGDETLDADLLALLVALDAPGVIDRGLEMMRVAGETPPPAWADLARRNDSYGPVIRNMLDRPPPISQLRIAHMLRTVDRGWSLEQRQAYFGFLSRAAAGAGGESYLGHIDRMRQRALETCSDAERDVLAPLLTPAPAKELPYVVPAGPWREWSVTDATRAVDGQLQARSFERGAGLYRAAICANCHQFSGAGANAGPDLTSVGNTYAIGDLLRAVIEPSHAITDQYQMSDVTLTDGETITGLIVDSTDESIRVATNFLNPEDAREIRRADVASIEASPVSPMPTGLLNPLNAEELRDLIAYLVSAGDPNASVFQR